MVYKFETMILENKKYTFIMTDNKDNFNNMILWLDEYYPSVKRSTIRNMKTYEFKTYFLDEDETILMGAKLRFLE